MISLLYFAVNIFGGSKTMISTIVFFLCALLFQACIVQSFLYPHALLSRSKIEQEAHREATAVASYSNDWAVQIEGNLKTVNRIAESHGFVNMGQVC